MKNKILFILLISLSVNLEFAQQEAMLSQYMYSGIYINPAFSGSKNYAEINGIFRKQWVNFEGAPTTQILSYDGAIKNKNMGLGAVLVNDKIGVSCRTDINLNYAYQIRTGEYSRLAFGIKGGVSYLRANLNELRIWDSQDEVFSVNLKSCWLPNAGTGLYFYSDKFYFGLSCPNIIDYSTTNAEFTGVKYPKISPHYYFNSSYVFYTDFDINLKPSVLFKYVKNAPFQADINLITEIKERLSIGLSYRTGDGILAMMQMVFSEKWKLGYSYDYPLTRINKYSSGSHEIMLSYRFNKKQNLEKNKSSF